MQRKKLHQQKILTESTLKDQIKIMFNSSAYWNAWPEEKKQKAWTYLNWARHTTKDSRVVLWIARCMYRAFVFLGDDERSRKKALAMEARGYDLVKSHQDLMFFLSKKNPGQFKSVYEDLLEKSKTHAVIRRALENITLTKPDNSDLSTQEVYNNLNEIYSLISDLEKLPKGNTIITLPDQSIWTLVNTDKCTVEGGLMKHCGNASPKPGDKILSYRIPSKDLIGYHVPKLTFIYNTLSKSIGEMKGHANSKPDAKYHQAIIKLLTSNALQIARLSGSGYAPERNFSLNDLSEKDFTTLCQQNPQLIKRQLGVASGEQALDKAHTEMAKKCLGDATAQDNNTAKYVQDLE